jgi:hypothetical protein
MLQLEIDQADDTAVLYLDTGARRRLARVLADWLSTYAGVAADAIDRTNFDLVVEARRLLLSPDEGNFATLADADRASVSSAAPGG